MASVCRTDLLDFGDIELKEHLEVELENFLDNVGLMRCTGGKVAM